MYAFIYIYICQKEWPFLALEVPRLNSEAFPSQGLGPGGAGRRARAGDDLLQQAETSDLVDAVDFFWSGDTCSSALPSLHTYIYIHLLTC